MKKAILLTALVALATTASAQMPQKGKVSMKTLAPSQKAVLVTDIDKVPQRKTATNGVYYSRPEGSFWKGLTKEGYFYYASYLEVAPGADIKYVNRSSDPQNAVWTINENVREGDENNDYIFGYIPGYYYIQADGANYSMRWSVPTLTVGNNSYTLGESNTYFDQSGTVVQVDTLSSMSYINPNDTMGSYAFGGSFDNYYIYGSGTITDTQEDGSTMVSVGYGISQRFPAPMSPLYVEGIHAMVATQSQPIAGDAAVKAILLELVNDSTLGDTIAVLTATADECTALSEMRQYSFGSYAIYNVDFTQKELDELGQLTTVPFTVKSDFVLRIVGLDQEGVDMGFRACQPADEDNVLADYGTTRFIVKEDTSYLAYSYRAPLYVELNFDALFDDVEVYDTLYDTEGNPAYTNLNILRVSADGQTISTEGAATDSTNIGAITLHTAFDWTDGTTGIDNYTITDMPDWISFDPSDNLNESERISAEEDNGYTYCYADGFTYLDFKVDPLPDGTTGRAARMYLQGRGVTADLPIIVLQGDADIADAVETVKADKPTGSNRTYNLRGQQVSNDFKGIRIQNGKKFLKK